MGREGRKGTDPGGYYPNLEWERSRFDRFNELVYEYAERGYLIHDSQSPIHKTHRTPHGKTILDRIMAQLNEELPLDWRW